jgi:RNA polymerase sigma-70 factor, ECF subfamily
MSSAESGRHPRVDALLEAIRSGDKRAFSDLVRELEPFVRGTSMKVCRDKAVADENAQDTLVTMHRNLHQFEGGSRFTTWLYTVIVNNCRMKRRRRKIDQASLSLEELQASSADGSVPELVGSSTDTEVLASELRHVLGRAIESLPEEYRSVFVLRQVEMLSTRETAEALSLSESAVKSRLYRARAMVRSSIESYVGERGNE